MKNKIILATISIFLVTAPVFAAQSFHRNGNNGNHGKPIEIKEANDSVTETPSPTVSPSTSPSVTPTKVPSVSPSVTPCDPNAKWKNHGQYVSCVAHEHLGGDSVSDAAKSDIGKKVHPTEPEISPTSTLSPTITPLPTISGVSNLSIGSSPFKNLGKLIESFFDFLKHLI